MAQLSDLVQDWHIHLRGQNRSKGTIDSYLNVARAFLTYLEKAGLPTDAAALGSEHLSGFLAHLNDRVRKGEIQPATVGKHYRSLQQLFKWLKLEDEIAANPFDKLSPPTVPEKLVPILTEEDIRRLLAACAGKRFEDRRDDAMVRMLLDTGMRAEELMGLTGDDVDRFEQTALVHGKGGRDRVVRFGNKTAEALSRYMRARARVPQGFKSKALWIGRKGGMTTSGLRQMLERRGEIAGVPGVHPHRFRHTFGHMWSAAGGQESDLMRLAGWKSEQMVRRYGASAADSRARDAHKTFGPGDKF